ncbi:hypothetical protein SUGI_0728190 [Cryptomeria japonica]|nr:hypothetical protein SUGI_0728190 [Cryptomeria japonica]
MAEDLYSLFFSRVSYPEHDMDPPSAVRLHHNNLDDENTQQLILHPEEAMKRKRNKSIVLSENMRKKMRHMFCTLKSLLPISIVPKLPRDCIIEETGKYIQNLQNKTQELQKKKAQLLTDQNSSAIDVGIEIYNNEIVIIRVIASRMPRSLCKIYQVVEEVGLEIERADVYRGDCIVFLYLQATVIVSTGPRYLLEMSQTRPCLQLTLKTYLLVIFTGR